MQKASRRWCKRDARDAIEYAILASWESSVSDHEHERVVFKERVSSGGEVPDRYVEAFRLLSIEDWKLQPREIVSKVWATFVS